MKNLPKLIFFLLLILYPIFSYLVSAGAEMVPHYVFGVICFLFMLHTILQIYRAGTNLIIPNYLIFYGLFTAYTIISGMLLTDLEDEMGVQKYFYTNLHIYTFLALLIIENISFPSKWIALSAKALGVILVLAATVSVIQIFDPLFFTKSKYLIQGLSYERIGEYYSSNPDESTNSVSRLFKGYRTSIFSYINEISVGIDTIAIFSLLLAYKTKNKAKLALYVMAAAMVSFLSSARWIMLNFVVVGSQYFWTQKNKISNSIKYLVYGITLILFIAVIAYISGIDLQRFTQDRLLSNSASTRLLAVEVFLEVFPDNPILGTGGIDTSKMLRLIEGRSSQIHVGYLKLFYYHGLVGGLLYLGFTYSLLKRLWRRAKFSNYWGGFYAILAFFIANLTLVELDLFYPGLILAFIFSNHLYSETQEIPHLVTNRKKGAQSALEY
ncbi:O-antigen ligase [uncultured Eudoraea sp.]|uniref:O-antigen ligase family protein n=1 Tax=uncultured Eudoraea sp. TaxID=1035614 RepID=UPI0026347826|nr:O-antigen ligase family protein [uncultured Eudoraea sp.]